MTIKKYILYKPDEADTLKRNYERLILSLLILQPPLRTSFYRTATFITKIKDNGTDNYILINKKKKVATFIVNNDKASNYKVKKRNPYHSLN